MAQIKPLSEELQKVANDELGEVPSRIPDDLEALKLWIQLQPHLNARTDDQFLIQFLRGCKYSLEKAKMKLDHFHALRSKYPEMFGVYDVDEPKLREIIRLGCFAMTPNPRNETGSRIVVFRFNYDTNHYCADDIIRPLSVLYEMLMMDDPYACVQGVTFIMDMSLAKPQHFLQAKPVHLQNLETFLEKAVPLRIKAIYYLNLPKAVQYLFKMCLPFLSEKLKQRVHLCGSFEELAKHMSLKDIPQDYGGYNGLLDDAVKVCESKLDEYRDYFKENVQYGTDERLRLGAPLYVGAMFGTGGSFRKITVD